MVDHRFDVDSVRALRVEPGAVITRSTKSIVDDFERAARTVIGRPLQRGEEWTSDDTLRLLKRLYAEVVDMRKEINSLVKHD